MVPGGEMEAGTSGHEQTSLEGDAAQFAIRTLANRVQGGVRCRRSGQFLHGHGGHQSGYVHYPLPRPIMSLTWGGVSGRTDHEQFSRWGLGRRSIPVEPRRFAPLIVAFRSEYTRASSPGGGSSLTRLVSRAPHRPRRSRGFHHRLLKIGIKDLTVLRGRLAPRALGLVMEWATMHQSELLAAWERAERHEAPGRISPLG